MLLVLSISTPESLFVVVVVVVVVVVIKAMVVLDDDFEQSWMFVFSEFIFVCLGL
jgi:hypothetical protein